MSIADEKEYGVTRSKLTDVRGMIARIEQQPVNKSPGARAASLRSLRAYENQLVEELTRYEIVQGIRTLHGMERVRASR